MRKNMLNFKYKREAQNESTRFHIVLRYNIEQKCVTRKTLNLRKETTPMQNFEEPFHHMACRREIVEAASALCMAASHF